MNQESDPNVGFVSLQEIRNVFVEFLRELDKVVMPEGKNVNRLDVLKCVESIQYRMFQRAVANYDRLLPGYRAPKPKSKPEDPLVLEKSAADRAIRLAGIRSHSSG